MSFLLQAVPAIHKETVKVGTKAGTLTLPSQRPLSAPFRIRGHKNSRSNSVLSEVPSQVGIVNEFRREPITGRWVIISTLSDSRPNHFRTVSSIDADDGTLACPFCAHQMNTSPVVASYCQSDTAPWQVSAVPNRYPVVHSESEYERRSDVDGLFVTATDVGFHEVVIESLSQVTSVSELSTEQDVWSLVAYGDRMRLKRDAGMAFALPTKNSGASAEASL